MRITVVAATLCMGGETFQPADVRSEKKRSGLAMPANAKMRESLGTTTVSPVSTMRGGSSDRVMWYALRTRSARPVSRPCKRSAMPSGTGSKFRKGASASRTN